MNEFEKYGDVLGFRGVVYEPINEQGVIVIFSKIAEDIGFLIVNIRESFPDCLALRKTSDKNKKVLIEFEYKSKNFKDHGHDADKCDLIVCWEHNWEDYPKEKLEIMSLRDIVTEIKRMELAESLDEEVSYEVNKEDREIKEFFTDKNIPDVIKAVFYELDDQVNEITDSIMLNVAMTALTYYKNNRVFLFVKPQMKSIKCWLWKDEIWKSIKLMDKDDVIKNIDVIKDSYDYIIKLTSRI